MDVTVGSDLCRKETLRDRVDKIYGWLRFGLLAPVCAGSIFTILGVYVTVETGLQAARGKSYEEMLLMIGIASFSFVLSLLGFLCYKLVTFRLSSAIEDSAEFCSSHPAHENDQVCLLVIERLESVLEKPLRLG
jgi:hypothetical protein